MVKNKKNSNDGEEKQIHENLAKYITSQKIYGLVKKLSENCTKLQNFQRKKSNLG